MAFRDGPFENLKVPLVWTAAAVVVVALIAAVVLIVQDRRTAVGQGAPNAARDVAGQVAAPAGGVLAAPFRWIGGVGDHIGGYFFAVSDNRRLREENERLRVWRDEALALKTVNGRYEALLGIRTDPPMPRVAGFTVSEARGPYRQFRLINVGTQAGVRIGNPAMNEHGLIGRVSGATAGVSRVMMLTDVGSRTPVLIERTDARALLTGDGSGNPRLQYLRGGEAVRVGDRVMTSGDGGTLPRGLPVGIVAQGLDGSWRVKLYSDRGPIDYVQVLLFESFAQLADDAALTPPALSGLDVAPPPDGTQAAAIIDAQTRRAVSTVQASPAAQPPVNPPASPARPAPAATPAAPPAATRTVTQSLNSAPAGGPG